MCCSVLQRHLNGFHSGPGQSVDRGRIVEPRGALVLPGIDHPKTASRREKSQPARIALCCFLVTGNQAASSKRHTESIQLNLPRSIAEWGAGNQGYGGGEPPYLCPCPPENFSFHRSSQNPLPRLERKALIFSRLQSLPIIAAQSDLPVQAGGGSGLLIEMRNTGHHALHRIERIRRQQRQFHCFAGGA